MVKKIILLSIVILMISSQLKASSLIPLKAAFDEMNYALTVEWDQKDQSFYESQLKKFTATVRELQKTGLTNAQMIEFAKSQIKNAQVAKDLETAFSMITINKMSSEEASRYMMDSMKRAYSNGASWNDEIFLYLPAGVLVVVIALVLKSKGVSIESDDHSCFEDCYYYKELAGYHIITGEPVYSSRLSYTCDNVCH